MSAAVTFTCPRCGNGSFKIAVEIKTLEDFLGSVCTSCNTAITEDDIKAQAKVLTDKLIRDAFQTGSDGV